MYRRDLSTTEKKCPCIDNYFDNGNQICASISFKSFIPLECSFKCLTCVDIETKCLSCNTDGTYRIDDASNSNSCPCATRYYDNGFQICECTISDVLIISMCISMFEMC